MPPTLISIDTLPPPRQISLDTVSPPIVIPIPKNINRSMKLGECKIEFREAGMPMAHFTNFGVDEGLPSGLMRAGFMDRTGHLWFAAGNKICRYDGSSFSTVNLGQGAPIYNMCQDNQGRMWFATWGNGALCYDGIRISSYTTADGLAHDLVFDIFPDTNGDLWFATFGGGVSRYDGNKFTTINESDGLASNLVTRIIKDKKGRFLFGTTKGASFFDGKVIKNYSTRQGLVDDNIFSLLQDSSGTYWFGTQKGVSSFDGTRFTTLDLGKNAISKNINEIVQDDDGTIWFGSVGGGAYKLENGRVSVFTTSQGLPDNESLDITIDRRKNIWFGTAGGGLSRYNGKSYTVFNSKQNLLNTLVLSVAEDKNGIVWMGSYQEGLSKYDGNSFTRFYFSDHSDDNIINAIYEDSKGTIWFGTNGGLMKYDGNRFYRYTELRRLGFSAFNWITEDHAGQFWFATIWGLSRFDGKILTNYSTEQGITNNIVTSVVEAPDHSIWLTTDGNGVSRFDGRIFTHYTVEQGLADNNVKCMLKDRSGNLWFGTANGISRFDGEGFISFNSAHGLPDDMISSLAEDEHGVIWCGTDKGLCSLKFRTGTSLNDELRGPGFLQIKNQELSTREPLCEIYSNTTGYPIIDMWERSLFISKPGSASHAKNGIIWGATSDEQAFRLDPALVKRNYDKPVPFLKSVKINETLLDWYGLGSLKTDSVVKVQQERLTYGDILSAKTRDSLHQKFTGIRFDSIAPFYQVPYRLILPYTHNRVTIDFGAIETSRNFMVRYEYMLEGYDNEWSPVTEKTSITYGNIDEGGYTFKLKARSPEGIWSDPITYSFKVLPPWWRTWWFRTLMGLSLAFLLYGTYRWRTAALRRQKTKLEHTVKERTAEVVKQKEKSDELLLNILPSEVADELKAKGHTTAKAYDEVAVLFSDIKGFTNVAENMSAEELVKEIDTYFSSFDRIIMDFGLEKIKTIGDAYVAAGGLPENNPATAQHVVEAAIAMQKTVEEFKQERIAAGRPYFELRIGIHTGPVVAGVVGIKKFQYDIWGDTVNLAARMEQSGVAGKINISQHTYELVKEHFNCVHRGKIDAKNKGEIDMYFVG